MFTFRSFDGTVIPMAPSHGPTLRQCRATLSLSQAAFADRLHVSVESYRTWDSGRRPPPEDVVERARALADYPDDSKLLPLSLLAIAIGVHVRSLHAAARDGRLADGPVEQYIRKAASTRQAASGTTIG